MQDEPENIDDVIRGLADPIISERRLIDNVQAATDDEGRETKDIAPVMGRVLGNKVIAEQVEEIYRFFEAESERIFLRYPKEFIKFGILCSTLAHEDEPRKTGGYYIKHLWESSINLARKGWDYITIASESIHDNIENRVKKHNGAKINGILPRQHYREDLETSLNIHLIYLSSEKNVHIFKDETEERYNKIRKEYESRYKKKLSQDDAKKLTGAVYLELKNSFLEINRRLSKSERNRYERYGEDLFAPVSLSTINLPIIEKLEAENHGFSEIYKNAFSDLHELIIDRTAAGKGEDRINNIQTMEVIDIDLTGRIENLEEEERRIKATLYKGSRQLTKWKTNIIDNCKINMDDYMDRDLLPLNIYIRRRIGHGLLKRHFITGFFSEKGILRKLKSWKTYRSFKESERFPEYWKNLILIDRLKNYLENYEWEKRESYEKLTSMLSQLNDATIEQTGRDIEHIRTWHLEPKDVKKSDYLYNRYESEGGLEKITDIRTDDITPYKIYGLSMTNEHIYLDGVSYILKEMIHGKEPLARGSEKQKRINEIKDKLENDRGYQRTVLKSLKYIFERYKEHGWYIEGLFNGNGNKNKGG